MSSGHTVSSCHTMSSCHTVSPCDTMLAIHATPSCHTVSPCHLMAWRATMPYLACNTEPSGHTMPSEETLSPCHTMSLCQTHSSCHTMPAYAGPCHHAIPCHTMPFMPCHAIPGPVSGSSGPLFESKGARLTRPQSTCMRPPTDTTAPVPYIVVKAFLLSGWTVGRSWVRILPI